MPQAPVSMRLMHSITCHLILPRLQVALSSLVSQPHHPLQLHPEEDQEGHGHLVYGSRQWKPQSPRDYILLPKPQATTTGSESSDIPGSSNLPTTV